MTIASNDSISTLIGISHAMSNNFEVTITPGWGSLLPDHKYLCSKVSFPGPKLSFERHKVTRLMCLKAAEAYGYTDEVTITWYETENFAIRSFHETWFSKFYNREKDTYISSGNGEIPTDRSITIAINLGGNKNLKLTNVFPASFPDLTLDYATSGPLQYTLAYKATSWSFT